MLAFCLSLLALGLALARIARLRAALGDCTRGRQASERLLRLTAGEQRKAALSLLGHAEQKLPDGAALAGLARRLLEGADDVLRCTDEDARTRRLTEEPLSLGPVVDFAVAQVASQLGPARRAWRISPDIPAVVLSADRRALNQVLVSTLSAAATHTRDGDWIELSLEQGVHCAIVVQDEGIGLPRAAAGAHPLHSRGFGVQLSLARSLMRAHGGDLTVESTERVGARVRLCFPSSRVLQAEPQRGAADQNPGAGGASDSPLT